MKIAIIGSGAMGSLYGALLSEKNEVWCVDVWQEHVAAINAQGLKIKRGDEEQIYHPKATVSAEEVGQAELVIIFVKSIDTAAALEKNRALFGEHTMVLTLQNGYGNDEDILPYAKEENLLLGTTAAGATMLGPGHVFQAGMGPTCIGVRKGGKSEKVSAIIEVLREAGFQADFSDDVLKTIWTKLLVNVGINAPMALLNTRNGFIADSQFALQIGRELVAEAVAVAQAEGFAFDVDEIVEHYYIQGSKVVGHNRCSMLQDVDKKRKTEIEKINGAVSKMGKKHNIATPYNDLMVKLVNAKEDSYHYE